ncbi:MAG: FG-GAP-like repeat-containing protein [Bacteroidetes bacterium]|nr:FG-GAP-like repeat-containing protein [Bacteroidota bacterium]
MKKPFFILLISFLSISAFAAIDTLRYYTPGTPSLYFQTYPIQIARFNLPQPGNILSFLVTLGGDNPSGSATLHLYGHEGGNIIPELKLDLTPPLALQKTIAGDEKILVTLTSSVHVDNNQFFVWIDNFQNGAKLASDNVAYTAFCLAGSSGGDFYWEYLQTASASTTYKTNAFKIDVIIDYETLPVPSYFEDFTGPAGILSDAYSNRGASVGDFNHDGWDDFIRRNLLYKNVQGTFVDITTSAGVSGNPYASAFADMNNDGLLDIVYVLIDSIIIYRNNGDETFTPFTAATSSANLGYDGTQTLSVADINNDKYPDLFIGRLWKTYPTPLPNYLYLNNQDFTLTDITSTLYPIPSENLRRTRASQFVDYNEDGLVDLYVTNYYLERDEFWQNNGNATFTNIIAPKGIDSNATGSNHGTGVAWADYDNDGDMDLLLPQFAHPAYVAPYDHRGTTIYQNDGPPAYNFTDLIGTPSLDDDIEFEETHAGAVFGDVDNDGLTDFYITNFYNCRYSDFYIQKPDHKFELKTQYYLSSQYYNTGEDALMFDFNNDGKLDLVTGQFNKFVILFKNNIPGNNNYLKLLLRSVSGNSYTLGGRATVYAGGQQFTREVYTGRGARMGDPYTLHFGLGASTSIDSVVVKWPVNPPVYETFTGLTVNQAYTLEEGGHIVITGQHNNETPITFNVNPNPATDQITVSAYLTKASEIELTIRKITGSESLKLLPLTKVSAGSFIYKITEQQLSHLSPGVYLVCMKTNGIEQCKKTVLIR